MSFRPRNRPSPRALVVWGLLLLSLGLAGGAGCKAEIEGLTGKQKPGLDPPGDRFYYPTGVAVTPDGRYLFVTSGNADLKYNGGMLHAVDLVEAVTRVINPLSYPETCREAPQQRGLVECQEGDRRLSDGTLQPGVVLKELTVRTGFYPGFIAVEDLFATGFLPWQPELDGGGVRRYRLYTPVRGDPSITMVDVVMTSEAADAELTCLDCGDGCTKSGIRDCQAAYRIEAPSEGRAAAVGRNLQDEPYDLLVDPQLGIGVVAHLVDGGLALIDLVGYQGSLRPGGPDLVDVLVDVMAQNANGTSGGYDVVARTPGDPHSWFYVSNRSASQILVLRVTGAGAPPANADRGLRISLGPSIVLSAPFGPLESGVDVRGLAMSDDGNRLFALSRTPPSMLVIDTSLVDGSPKNEVIDAVEVCSAPSVLRVRRDRLGRQLAYAVCFGASEIYVVDTDDGVVIDTIFVGGGPHDIAFTDDASGVAPEVRGFGFVSHFAENTIGVIDLRDDSARYHQMIGRLGWPEEIE